MPKGFQPQLFWRNVNKDGPEHPTLGKCWIWNRKGNGYVYYSNQRAHRLSYKLLVADPGDMLVLHSCDNPRCVNPGHLFLGTSKDNIDDMSSKGRDRKAVGKGSTRKHKWGKVTPEQVLEIKALRQAGWTYPKLGEHFGIGSESARLIVKGRYHNHGS